MNKGNENAKLIDRYLRDELMADEEEAFEMELLESPEMQLQLETAMAIQRAILLTDEFDRANNTQAPPVAAAGNHWPTWALAASVTLALFSTIMFWKLSTEAGALRSEIDALRQPRTTELIVPVDIMRSADQQTPDVVIQKPDADVLMVLDIELSGVAVRAGPLQLVLRDAQSAELFSWGASGSQNGRLSVAFNSSVMPRGRVWLEISGADAGVLDRRLLEFR